MVLPVNYFEKSETLEPHCPGCDSKVDFGLTTNYDEQLETHVCNTCSHAF